MSKIKKPQMGEIYWLQYFDQKKFRFTPSRVVGWNNTERENANFKTGIIRTGIVEAQALSDDLNRAIERVCPIR